jgi:hypothetical protein
MEPPAHSIARTTFAVLVASVVAGLAAGTGGCVSPPPTAEAFERDTLRFVRDGQTTREEVLLKMGTPTGQFEGDRILTYRLAPSGNLSGYDVYARELMQPPGRAQNYAPVDFSLVLVFGPDGVLRRHSVVPLKNAPDLANAGTL